MSNVGVAATIGYNLECIAPGATFGTKVYTLPANCGKVLSVVF